MDEHKLKIAYGIFIVIALFFILIGGSLWGKYDPIAQSAYEAGQTLTIIGINILVTLGIVGYCFIRLKNCNIYEIE